MLLKPSRKLKNPKQRGDPLSGKVWRIKTWESKIQLEKLRSFSHWIHHRRSIDLLRTKCRPQKPKKQKDNPMQAFWIWLIRNKMFRVMISLINWQELLMMNRKLRLIKVVILLLKAQFAMTRKPSIWNWNNSNEKSIWLWIKGAPPP